MDKNTRSRTFTAFKRLGLTILCSLISITAWTQNDLDRNIFDVSDGRIEITQGTSPNTVKVLQNGILTPVKDNIPQAEYITIRGTTPNAGATEAAVRVSGSVTANIILDNVTIDYYGDDTYTNNRTALDVSNAEVHLYLLGNNTLRSGRDCSAVNVPAGSSLIIHGPGTLTAQGGNFAAGIGGGLGKTAGAITINGGIITATGGNGGTGGAGIGGGGYLDGAGGGAGAITINGGRVTATGNDGGAGIGCGYLGLGGTVTINGGLVKAVGAKNASVESGAGIGGGFGSGSNINAVSINGGSVLALSASSAGIGCGYGASGGSPTTINGGTVIADGLGINKAGGGGTSTVTISSNSVIFATKINGYSSSSGTIQTGAGVVDATGNVTMNANMTITNSLTVPPGITLKLGGKTLTINSAAALGNFGTVAVNSGTLVNNGHIINYELPSITGSINGTPTGTGTVWDDVYPAILPVGTSTSAHVLSAHASDVNRNYSWYNGASWLTACPDLADPLLLAGIPNGIAGDAIAEIRVASGVYLPKYKHGGATDRHKTFKMVSNVNIYGGFAAPLPSGATAFGSAGRNGVSVLSGDIGTANVNTDNAYHVVTASGVAATPVLSGFTVTGGNANGGGNDNTGGGLYLDASAPKLEYLKVSGNAATTGGALYLHNASPALVNVLVSGNTGDGLYLDASAPTLTNVTIAGNSGTGINATGSGSPTIQNSIVYGNATGGVNAAGATYSHSLVQDVNPSGIGNLDGTTAIPRFIRPVPSSSTPTTDGDYRLSAYSPCNNAGDNASYLAARGIGGFAGETDLAGVARLVSTTIDMGAYETENPVNSPFSGRVYVKAGGAGSANGSSWSNAYPNLADLLMERENGASIAEIWVATGTYYPKYKAGNGAEERDKAFAITKNVKIYGGFVGDETDLSGRNTALYPTVLSGDIGTTNDPSDNAYHVVMIASGNVRLDGLTVTDGNADGTASATVGAISFDRSKGGGVYNASSNAVFAHLTVKGNRAHAQGGGVYNTATLQLYNALIAGNSVSGNSGGFGGGGMYNSGTAATQLVNVTIAGNDAIAGSGMMNDAATPAIKNTIIWGNNNGSNIQNINSSTPTYQNSLVQGINPSGDGNLDGTIVDPLFVDAASGDYRLHVISLAVNAGNTEDYKSIAGISDFSGEKDLSGNPRLLSAHIDMGAHETKVPIPTANIVYVTTDGAGNKDGSSWSNAYPKLADPLKFAAMQNSKFSAADSIKQIWVAQGTYYPMHREGSTTNDRDNTFALSEKVKIYGGFEGNEANLSDRNPALHPTVLSGDIGTTNDPSDNAYHVVTASNVSTATVLSGFTITGGNASSNSGGGIYLTGGDPLLADLIISNNEANSGGGIYSAYASPRLINVIVKKNTAAIGGGIYSNISTSALFNVLISENTAITGGGMYNSYYSSPVLTNVTVAGNTADEGSGIYNDDYSSPELYNTIVWGNDINGKETVTLVYEHSLVQGINPSGNGNLDGTDPKNDPKFINISTGNFALSACSPAIDAGDSTKYIAEYSATVATIADMRGQTDVTGNARRRLKNVDMGAYEAPAGSPTIAVAESKRVEKGTADVPVFYLTGTSPWKIAYTWNDGTDHTVNNQNVASSPFKLTTSSTPSTINAGIYTFTPKSVQDGGGCNTPNTDVSGSVTITVTEKKPQLAQIYSYENEKIRILSSDNSYNGSYSINDGPAIAFFSAGNTISEAWFGTTINIATANANSLLNSDPISFTIPARPAAPSATATNAPIEGGKGSITITGDTWDMYAYQYKLASSPSWTYEHGSVGPFTIFNLSTGTYEVRKSASSTAFASEKTTVTIGCPTCPVPSRKLTVSPPAFNEADYGDAQPAAAAITIRNVGTLPAIISGVTLTTGATGDFVLGDGQTDVAAGSSNTSWTIRPKADLGAGTYTVGVEVAYDAYGDDAVSPATATVTFTVNRKPIRDCTITPNPIPDQQYTGSQIRPAMTVQNGGITLTENTDYEIIYGANTDKGQGSVTINGKGNYGGSVALYFDISTQAPPTFTVDLIDPPPYTYTGSAIQPVPVVKNGATVLVNGVDYTVAYGTNIDAGTGSVTVTGAGGYTGSVIVSFIILPKVITFALTPVPAQEYTGNPIKPSAEVEVKDGATVLTVGMHYALTYGPNTVVGIGSGNITVTGTGNYAGSSGSATFDILPKNTTFTVTAVPDQTYTGNPIKPEVTVKDGNIVLTAGTHYTVSYGANVNAGSDAGSVIVTGIGGYAGSFGSKTFNILKAKSTLVVSIVRPTLTFGGNSDPQPYVISRSGSGSPVVFTYKREDAPDSEYSATLPVNAGNYMVRGFLAEDANHSAAWATTNYVINKATSILVIRQDDIAWGETPDPQIVTNTGGGTVTFAYKLQGASDDAYSAAIPTRAGDYTVRGAAFETPNYTSSTATDDFSILPVVLSFNDYVDIKWDNTLMMNMKQLREKGFTVNSYRWRMNGNDIGNESKTFSQGPKRTDLLPDAKYSFVLSTSSHGNVVSDEYSFVSWKRQSMSVYPNPVRQGTEVRITIPETEKAFSLIEIYDATGKVVQQLKAESDVAVASLHLPAGIYFVKVNGQTVKLIIEN
jgi:hypothetical protein